eukprot:gb/GEZN01007324.1/.p1 GENE.gb/GEZN01007324.1/~~gb/GEZN01007324.1/.p1  ORF type:complete len:178 (+),score=21.14 gb/GEZN01007324.1/:554-1087(+)
MATRRPRVKAKCCKCSFEEDQLLMYERDGTYYCVECNKAYEAGNNCYLCGKAFAGAQRKWVKPPGARDKCHQTCYDAAVEAGDISKPSKQISERVVADADTGRTAVKQTRMQKLQVEMSEEGRAAPAPTRDDPAPEPKWAGAKPTAAATKAPSKFCAQCGTAATGSSNFCEECGGAM